MPFLAPRHDNTERCLRCRYVTRINDEDIWVCGSTIIRRYGSKREDYYQINADSIFFDFGEDHPWRKASKAVAEMRRK